MPSTVVALTKAPRAIRVALLAAPLAWGTASPSIRVLGTFLLSLKSALPLLLLCQCFNSSQTVPMSSPPPPPLSYLKLQVSHEPFPRHFLLSPSQSTITCKTELSPVFCAAQEEERQAVATACVAFAACGASMSQELSSPPYQGFPTRAFHNVAEQMF